MVKISVIIPVYNSGEYLKQCLDSILSQSYIDFEIICIDDFSSDNSLDILQEYSLKDSRITIIRNPYNIGAARSRNIGIQFARGEYVIILDSDDYFENDFIEDMYNKLFQYDADVVLCNYDMVDSKTKETLGTYHHIEDNALKKMKGLIDKEFFQDRLLNLFIDAPWNKMVKRDFLLEYDLLFQDLRNSNDVYWSAMIIILANKITYINRKYIHNRVNIDNQISSSRKKITFCSFEAYYKIFKKLNMLGLYEKYRNTFELGAISAFNYQLSCIHDNELREKYIFEMLDSKLKALNMPDNIRCNEYKTAFIGDDIYGKAIDLLKKDTLNTYALWGYGNFGKSFADACNKHEFKLLEIYDRDINKHGFSKYGVPILDYPGNNVDVIIINNYYLIDYVKEAMKSNGKKQKIILIYGNLIRWQGEKSIILVE